MTETVSEPTATPSPTETEETSITQFVTRNEKALAALGVFFALTAFANTLPIKGFATLLSVSCFGLTVLLWLELKSKFPKDASSRLAIFELFLTATSYLMLAYLVLQINHSMPVLMGFFIFTGSTTGIINLWLRLDISSKVKELIKSRPLLGYPIVAALTVGTFYAGVMLTMTFTPLVNYLLEIVYRKASADPDVFKLDWTTFQDCLMLNFGRNI